MTYNRFGLAVRTTAALVFLVSTYFLGNYYFMSSPQYMEVVERVRERFYGELKWSWLRPEVTSIRSQLKSEKLTDFNRFIVATALTRWRVQSFAYHAYDNILSDFRRGLWNDSFIDDLTALLNEIDHNWIDARQQALTSQIKVVPEMQSSLDVGFNLRFPDNVTTAEIGSLLEILITVRPGSTPVNHVDVYWETARDPGASHLRLSAATLENTNETTAGLPLYRVRLDMSQSPQWLEPTAEPVYVNFRGTAPVHWTPIAYTSTDSPQLPITEVSKPYELP